MPEIRVIRAVAVLMVMFVVGAFVWYTETKSSSPLDEQALRRIERMCGFQAECKVRLADLFGGDWDTFYEFGVGLDQASMSLALGGARVRHSDRQRTFVLTKNGRVVASEHETYGIGHPLDGQVEFESEDRRERSWVKFDRETWLRARSFRTESPHGNDTYYVLTVEDR